MVPVRSREPAASRMRFAVDADVSIKNFVRAMDSAGFQDKPTRHWLAEYGGPGEHARKSAGEDRLSFAYDHDHVLDDLGVICELSGIDSWRIADALEAARRSSDNPSAQAGVFRQMIPWKDVAQGAGAFAGRFGTDEV